MREPAPLLLPRTGFRQPGELLQAHYHSRIGPDPGREALWMSDLRLSHAELGQRIADLQAAIAAAPPLRQPGGIWGIHCGNSLDHLALGLALLFEGIPQVLLPTHASPAELAGSIDRCGIAMIATDRALPPALGLERLAPLGQGIDLWGSAQALGAENPPHRASDDLEILLDRTAGLGLTSGTTTGVPSVHRSTFFQGLATLQQPAWPPVGRMLMTFRLQFGASRGWAMRVLLEGGTICGVREGEADRLAHLAGDAAADGYCANPPTLQRLVEERADRHFPTDLVFMSGSDRVAAGLRRRFHERFGARLWVVYASSQSGPLSRLPPERLLEHDGESIGLPLPGVSFDLSPVSGGAGDPQAGEVVVQKCWKVRLQHPQGGPLLVERHQKDFRPGDLLRQWPDGSYSFAGRANDVFLFRSVLVSPHEIENILEGDASVAEVVGFGAPSSRYGAVPMAVVVLKASFDQERELPRLRRLCRQAMGYRAPKALMAVEKIPRGPSGKPLRRVLAERYALS